MISLRILALFAPFLLAAQSGAPQYTPDGRLRPPPDYREWIYLSSGLDMSYTPQPGMAGHESVHSTFDNVFVNPEAYRAFLQTGAWPDKTMLVLESRAAAGNGSINKSGHFQSGSAQAVEVHLKDNARGGWAFYAFAGFQPAQIVPKNADCYSCHSDHAAVDTTFVQFYPTLLPLAQKKDTLSPNFRRDQAKSAP